jgi:undecaprenyl diphosphate synthase
MDGNGRWAQRRGPARVFGHIRGSLRVKEIVKEAHKLGIRALTLYAFSTENWNRPEAELGVLWRILKKYLRSEIDDLDRNGVKLNIIGEVERLSPDIREILEPAIRRLSKNTKLEFTLAVSYGGRRELARAAQRFAKDCLEGRRAPDEMTETLMGSYLWTDFLGELGEVDLVIRTSGEKRISNFLLWQAAYAEYVFTDTCWPDFRAEHLKQAVQEFSSRERRFGGIQKDRKDAKERPHGVRAE